MASFLAVFGLLVSCATSQVGTPSASVSRASLPFSANGIRYEGIALLQRATSTHIDFHLPPKTLELAITSCHREVFAQAPASPYRFTYQPIVFLENWDTCIVRATAFLHDGSTQQAIIDWTSNEFLPGTVYCNGTKQDGVKGATFCQSRAGLVQMVQFAGPVEARGPERCNQPRPEKTSPDYRWFIDLSPGLCIYAFSDSKRQFHRLTTYGYTAK